ncbi:BRO family protein [Acetobacter sp. DsW_059]|uniref:BRO-N domain-containing protein n=1 Tax=Acetobacter sp. DsW_059 TaxID=1670661 RepID=UPI000A3880D7|nr:BRO family protein [Acetobacter sp. DsW_059]
MSDVITSGVTPAIVPFNFEGTEVRVNDRNGEPWWVLADVCKVLEIANAPHAASRLDDDEKTTVAISDSGNLNADRTIINESGLWSLVLTSRKSAAKRFKKWITSEVIPSIRKTGSYSVATAPKLKRVRKPSVLKAFKDGYGIAKIIGFDDNQATISAGNYCLSKCGENPLPALGLASLTAPNQDNYQTPTELGAELGLSGRKVNQLLSEELHLQKHTPGSSSGSDWSMTEKGLAYGRMFDSTRKGGKGSQQQLKWKPSVVEFLRPFALTPAETA